MKNENERSWLRKRIRRFLYRNYWASSGVTWRLRRRVTRAGWLVIAGMFLMGGVGMDTNQAVAYQGFAVLGVLVGMSMVWSGWRAPELSVRRLLPRYGTVGEPLPYRIFVRNSSGRAERGLFLAEDFADPRPSFEEFLTIAEPGEAARNPIDRWFGYYRWRWLLSRREMASAREKNLPVLGAGQEMELAVELRPRRRGAVHFAGATVMATEPFGLFRRFRRVSAAGSVLILPKRYPVARLPFLGRKEYQHGGVALASAVGESEEFIGLREYRPGDSLRHIHWKSWAKLGKPVVKEFQDEFFARHALVLDTFGEGTGEELFEEAVAVAASFAAAVDTQESLLDLLFVGVRAYCFTAGRSLAHIEQILEILASVEMSRERSFEVLSDLVLEHANCVSSCVCVLLKWDSAREGFVRKLAKFGTPLTVFVMAAGGAVQEPLRLDGVHFSRIEWIEVGKARETLARL